MVDRTGIRLAVFLGILAIQIAVPVVQLTADRPVRFGWHMFAGVRRGVEFEVRHADGRVEAVAIDAYVLTPRQEVDLASHLPDHLCRTIPTAEAIAVHHKGRDGEPDEVSCP